jgi:hypothetical protein
MSLDKFSDKDLEEELKKRRTLKDYTDRELRDELLRRSGASMTPTGWKIEGKDLCVHGCPTAAKCSCGGTIYSCPRYCSKCRCM